MKVPAGMVLVVSSGDWFSEEYWSTAYAAGAEVESTALQNGRLLADGESVEITEKWRDEKDNGAWKGTHTETKYRIENKGGKPSKRKVS